MEDLPQETKDCDICVRAKRTKLQRHAAATRAREPLERVFIDFWGPYRRGSATGDEYILTITDDCTRYGWIFLTKDRSSKTLKKLFRKWQRQVERQSGKKVKRVRMDNISEFKALAEDLEDEGMVIEFITPYTHEQNGVAERMNRTLLTIMRALIFDSRMPKNLWPFAAETATYIRNRTVLVTPATGESKIKRTPYELWTGKELHLEHMQVWGCKVWIPVLNEKDKLNPRAVEGVFVGYTESPNQYMVWVPETKDLIKATNPDFIGNERGQRNEEPIGLPESTELGGAQQGGAQQDSTEDSSDEDVEDSNPNPVDGATIQAPTSKNRENRENRGRERRKTEPEIDESDQQPSGATTRSGRTVKFTKEMQHWKLQAAKRKRKTRVREIADMVLEHAMRAKESGEIDEFDQIPIPTTYAEAIQHPKFGSKWLEAIKNELNSLGMFKTWKLVKRPLDQSVVSCKWVFLVKYGTDGRPERFKARLVARGFTQQFGIDYEDTFAPVIRFESLRVLFALAAREKMLIHIMDAQNAYLNSDLDKEIYMEVPEGVEASSNEVCLLLKSIYGLKQSANLWNKKITSTLQSIGFEPTTAEPSIFIDKRGVIAALYVDDLLILAKTEYDVERVKNLVKKAHTMKDMGEVSKVLGIHVTRPSGGGLQIDQSHYIHQILMEFGMDNAKPTSTPMSPSIKLDDEASEILSQKDHELYRRMIGRLMFAAIAVRIDIATAVNRLSQYLSQPRKIHLQAAKHVLRYLTGSPQLGILYKPTGDLIGYADAAYANLGYSGQLRDSAS